MTDVVHDTFVLTRSYPKPPARVFAAFSETSQKRRWFADSRGAAEAYELDFRVGGTERVVYRMGPDTPLPGVAISNELAFQDIVAGERIVQSQTMARDGQRFSVALITFEFRAEGDGTVLFLTHQAAFLEGADGPQMRKGGWEQLLDGLAKVVA